MIHLCLLFGLVAAGADQPWPQWRGPNRDGVVHYFKTPATWPEKPSKLWSLPVGKGYGSPIVAADHAYVMSHRDNQEHIIAVSLKTGKQLWQVAYPIQFKENPSALRFGMGPFSTPLYHEGRVYTIGTTGQIHCIDAVSGKVVWKKTYNGDLTDTRKFFCGNSFSPIRYKDTVIVHIGNESEGIMSALDLKTGAEKWQWRGDVPGYASPVIGTVAGGDHMVTLTQNNLNGIDPQTGKLLWHFPFTSTWRENAISPILRQNTVIISGVERKTLALTLTPGSPTWQVNQHWDNEEAVLYMSNPVRHQGTLYGMSYKGRGRFFAMDSATGTLHWQGPPRMGKNSAVQLLGNHVAALTVDAVLRLFRADPKKYDQVAEYDLGLQNVWSEPVFFERHMLVKDDAGLHLFAFATP